MGYKTKGMLCKQCKKYRDWFRLSTVFTFENGKTFRAWYCDNGHLLKEEEV